MQIKRIWISFLCIALLAGLFSGCRIGEEKPFTPTGDGLYQGEGEGNNPVQNETSSKEQKMTLTYYPQNTFNPYMATDYTNRVMFSLLYQSLFIVDRNYHIEPMLCSRYSVSEDMKTYTFYMENATFPDGSILTAADVLASLQTAKEEAFYSGRFLYVEDIVLTDDGGVRIQLSVANENLPILLDIPIVKQTQVKEDKPMGTGPYVLEEGTGGLLLRRRADWWCKADVPAKAASIALIPAESSEQIRNNFQDKAASLNLVCTDPCSDSYADYRGDYELWDSENGIFLYLACNMDSAVFSVPEVRAALTHAIDREGLVKEFYRGFARPTTLPASPLSPYYNESLASRYSYDAVKFTQIVSDAGLRDAPIVLLVNRQDSLRVRVARSIKKMLADCGLSVELREYGDDSYYYALRNREYDLYLGYTKLSANMDLSAFFATTGALSYGGINDIAIYQMCQQALANHGNYYTLHQMIAEDGRLCPILFRSYGVYAKRGLVSGMTPSRDNIFYYSLGKTMKDAEVTP